MLSCTTKAAAGWLKTKFLKFLKIKESISNGKNYFRHENDLSIFRNQKVKSHAVKLFITVGAV